MAKELTGENRLLSPVYWLKNVSVSFLATVILLFIGALAATYFSIPDSVIYIIVMVCTAVCIAWGGFRFALHHGRQGLICGAVSGILYILILYFAGSLILGELSFSRTTALSILMAVFCGAVGGLVGVNLKPKKRR